MDSDTTVESGAVLELAIFLYAQEPPLEAERAAVRWTRGRAFGLEFLSVLSEDRQRLDRVLQAKRSLLVPERLWR